MSLSAVEEIEAAIRAMAEAWNRHDTKAYVAAWAEDCSFVNVLGMHRKGRVELLAEIDWLHAGRFKNTQIHIERHSVRFLTPDVAVAVMWWHMTGDPGMPGHPTQNGERHGVFTHVIQRRPEGWRFVASQNTDKPPIPDPLQLDPSQETPSPLAAV
ncbi:MAG: SgcJ/EcaC family oxidoreductase [Acidobacteriia bacterium]|nr:SgcJ/EcaC family oxidoreductase [Terriglobia bacterium]